MFSTLRHVYSYGICTAKTIKGTVVDVTGEPLIGVNVAVKGTTIGIITDIDGNYTLEVPSKSTIVFSYIGYQAQEVPVGNQSTINVTLKEDAQKLEEVVVVGYGTQKKVTVTGSVASVSGEELKLRRQPTCQTVW